MLDSSGNPIPGMEPCTDPEAGHLYGRNALVALLVVSVSVHFTVLATCLWRHYQRIRPPADRSASSGTRADGATREVVVEAPPGANDRL